MHDAAFTLTKTTANQPQPDIDSNGELSLGDRKLITTHASRTVVSSLSMVLEQQQQKHHHSEPKMNHLRPTEPNLMLWVPATQL